MRKVLCILLISSTVPAIAQQPTASPDVQACYSMLFERIQRDLEVRKEAFSFSAENVMIKNDLAKAQARIKELESKQEEKK